MINAGLLLTTVLVFACSAPVFGAEPGQTPQAAPPQPATRPAAADSASEPSRVLFIGNSYTMYNNMVAMFAALAAEAEVATPVKCTQLITGGSTFEGRWSQPRIMEPFRAGQWDIVVLQGHHDSPLSRKGLAGMMEYGRKFAAEAAAKRARVVYYMTWPKKAVEDKPAQAKVIRQAYVDLAAKTGGDIAPAGAAFVEAIRRRPELLDELYFRDGYHPAATGSYLVACTMFATIFGRSPEGLPGTLYVNDIDRRRGRSIVSVDAKTAAFLQQVAWQCVQEMRSSMPASRPAAPASRPADPAD